MMDHAHDSCSPTLHRDLEVTGQIQPEKAVDLAAPPEGDIKDVMRVTSSNVDHAITQASKINEVVVLIGNSLLPTYQDLEREILQFQAGNKGRFSLAIVDPDRSADVVARFRPCQIPVAYVVKDGASIAEFTSLNKETVTQWLDHFVSRETVAEMEEGDVDKQFDPRLWQAAELVNAGDFRAALALYEQLPQDTAVKRAHAAVSVLARMAAMDRGEDPIEKSRREPGNVEAALAAADMYVLMDQPDTALAHLAALLPQPEAAQRIVELLNLFDPLDPIALEIRMQLANAMN